MERAHLEPEAVRQQQQRQQFFSLRMWSGFLVSSILCGNAAKASSIMLGMHFERAMKPTMTTAAAAAKAVVGSGSALVRDNNANQTTIAILQPNDDTRKSFFVDVLNSQMLSQG